MINQVDYKQVVQAVAGDKYPRQNSLICSLVNKDKDVIQLNATNPKTNKRTTNLQMQIPIENLDDVIAALLDLKDQHIKSKI